MDTQLSESWLALVIGNTRLHWGYFHQGRFCGDWHTPHLTADIAIRLQRSGFHSEAWQSETAGIGALTLSELSALPTEALPSLSNLWIASVVPTQSALWLRDQKSARASAQLSAQLVEPSARSVEPFAQLVEPSAQLVERSHIPLSNLYPTLGIDRAINLLGAGKLAGWPTLVIDAGTAITLTAGVDQSVYGGAILPGMRLQGEALAQKTAVLGDFVPVVPVAGSQSSNIALPNRWAVDTEGAIASGLVYSVTATLVDYLSTWWQQFPAGTAFLTGGDALLIQQYLQQRTPEISSRVRVNHNLMFYGMNAYRLGLIAGC